MPDENTILREFLKLEYGTPLPRGEAFALFYQNSPDSGSLFYLRGDEGFHVFYADLDGAIESLNSDQYGWHLENEAGLCTLSLIQESGGAQWSIPLRLSRKDPSNMEFLEQLKERRAVSIHYLSLLHGELCRSRSVEYEIPDRILQSLLWDEENPS